MITGWRCGGFAEVTLPRDDTEDDDEDGGDEEDDDDFLIEWDSLLTFKFGGYTRLLLLDFA